MPPKFERSPAATPSSEEAAISAAMTEAGATVLATGETHESKLNLAVYGELPPAVTDALRRVADSAANYLERAVIADRFTDHEERRLWRDAVQQQYGEGVIDFFKRNRLRNNSLSPVAMRASRALEILGKTEFDATPRITELREAVTALAEPFGSITTFGARYTQMPFEEKRDLVFRVSDLARSYLDLVARPEKPDLTVIEGGKEAA